MLSFIKLASKLEYLARATKTPELELKLINNLKKQENKFWNIKKELDRMPSGYKVELQNIIKNKLNNMYNKNRQLGELQADIWRNRK